MDHIVKGRNLCQYNGKNRKETHVEVLADWAETNLVLQLCICTAISF